MRIEEESGQSTVEYSLVLVAFLAIVLALEALWNQAHEGRLVQLAQMSLSHTISGPSVIGGVQDIVLF